MDADYWGLMPPVVVVDEHKQGFRTAIYEKGASVK
jgi:hypothetical protein